MERIRRALTESNLVRMRIPRLFWEASVDKVTVDDPGKTVLLKYIENINEVMGNGVGMLLFGPNGSGKTAAAVLVAKEACRWGWTVLFVRAAELLSYEAKKMIFEEETKTTLWERAKAVNLLVIDDLGKESEGANSREVLDLEEFLRERISQRRVTICTTNLATTPGPESVHEKYKPSLLHLMKEAIVPVRFKGVDHREEKQRLISTIFDKAAE